MTKYVKVTVEAGHDGGANYQKTVFEQTGLDDKSAEILGFGLAQGWLDSLQAVAAEHNKSSSKKS